MIANAISCVDEHALRACLNTRFHWESSNKLYVSVILRQFNGKKRSNYSDFVFFMRDVCNCACNYMPTMWTLFYVSPKDIVCHTTFLYFFCDHRLHLVPKHEVFINTKTTYSVQKNFSASLLINLFVLYERTHLYT